MNSAASVMPIKAKKRRFMKNWDTNAAANDSAGRTSAKKIVCSTKDISANMPMIRLNTAPHVAPSNMPTATATAATAVITIATVIAIGRATATRTIIVTGVASITVIAIVEVTVGRTTATRTIIIAIIASAILGVISALYRDRWPDQIIRIFSIACIATPSFWLAVLFILLFSSTLHMLPASGALPPLTENPAGWLARMAMPGIALAVPLTGQMTRIIRTSMVEELDKDYVRTARGFGIPYGTVVARNVLRNALITPVTVLGLKFGYMIGGAVVLEVIFSLPGMGMAILSGVTSNYVMLVQGVVLVVAITFIIVNVIVDMLYILIDPRIRTV